jgi:type II secretory pathway pseudopilin PulG
MCKRRKTNGWAATEVVVSIGILALLFVVLEASMSTARKFNKYQLVKQQCIAAGQAQLDSIAATGEAISEGDFERLWPGIKFDIIQSPGSGQWEGMRLIKVTTVGRSVNRTKDVKAELYRYYTMERK